MSFFPSFSLSLFKKLYRDNIKIHSKLEVKFPLPNSVLRKVLSARSLRLTKESCFLVQKTCSYQRDIKEMLSHFKETTNTSLFCLVFKEGQRMILKNIMLSKRSQARKSTYIWNSRRPETNLHWQKNRSVLAWGWGWTDCSESGRGNFLGEQKCALSWLWHWLHRYIHLSKLIKLYIYLYANYTSIKLIQK